VLFFHQHLPFDQHYCNLARKMFNAPKTIMWYMVGINPIICKVRGPKVGHDS
jgi:hypothetical protein